MKTIIAALAVTWTVFAVGSGQLLAATGSPAAPETAVVTEWCKDDYRGH